MEAQFASLNLWASFRIRRKSACGNFAWNLHDSKAFTCYAPHAQNCLLLRSTRSTDCICF